MLGRGKVYVCIIAAVHKSSESIRRVTGVVDDVFDLATAHSSVHEGGARAVLKAVMVLRHFATEELRLAS